MVTAEERGVRGPMKIGGGIALGVPMPAPFYRHFYRRPRHVPIMERNHKMTSLMDSAINIIQKMADNCECGGTGRAMMEDIEGNAVPCICLKCHELRTFLEQDEIRGAHISTDEQSLSKLEEERSALLEGAKLAQEIRNELEEKLRLANIDATNEMARANDAEADRNSLIEQAALWRRTSDANAAWAKSLRKERDAIAIRVAELEKQFEHGGELLAEEQVYHLETQTALVKAQAERDGLREALERVAERDAIENPSTEKELFKLTRFQCAQIARSALTQQPMECLDKKGKK